VEFEIPALVENPVDADDTQPRLLLGDLLIWRFKISPDGKSVAVSEPGDRKLLLFDLTHESQR
jgi:hypothetical protein